jgi:hypothetical protein
VAVKAVPHDESAADRPQGRPAHHGAAWTEAGCEVGPSRHGRSMAGESGSVQRDGGRNVNCAALNALLAVYPVRITLAPTLGFTPKSAPVMMPAAHRVIVQSHVQLNGYIQLICTEIFPSSFHKSAGDNNARSSFRRIR